MSSNADDKSGRVEVERSDNASPGIFAQAMTEVHEDGVIYRGVIGGNGIDLGLQQRPQLAKDQTSDRGIALERARQSARGELQRGNLGLPDDGCRPGATIDD